MLQSYKGFSPEVHDTCFIAAGSIIVGNVRIGRNSSIWYNAVIRGDINRIVIGENTNIQDGSILHCAHGIPVEVGNNVTVGHGAILHSCSIGDFSLIGMGAIVLNGAKIGKCCLVGAGTLLMSNSDIPDGSLVLGNPGKVKRQLSCEEIDMVKKGAESYLELVKDYKCSNL